MGQEEKDVLSKDQNPGDSDKPKRFPVARLKIPSFARAFQNPKENPPSRLRLLAVCAFILISVALVFGQTRHFGFVNYDDFAYVYENQHVIGGLSIADIQWAFRSAHAGNWHPLTWISHMLDCQVYGLAAGGHHLTNVLLHGANAVLLFLILVRLTGVFWPSAFIALVFAIHPLRVESVAWVSERKDVLCGLFFMLTLGAYVGYVKRPFSSTRYLLVCFLFALGLMTKPMLVTLPFVLLLLDYWPLQRMGRFALDDPNAMVAGEQPRPRSLSFLLIEKLPLFFLVAASCTITLFVQRAAGGMHFNEFIPLHLRIANAAVTYVTYIGQLFYPAHLAVLYPHPGLAFETWKGLGATLILATVSVATLLRRRTQPYLLVGWLWYLGMLVPVIGLVQVGKQSMADRYTYLPQIGLVLAVSWGAIHATRSWRYRQWVGWVVSILIILSLSVVAWRQTGFWRNSETLWTHTLSCTSNNVVAHVSLGMDLAKRGHRNEAIAQYRKALAIRPTAADAWIDMGIALADMGRLEKAIKSFQKGLRLKPRDAEAHNNLGMALARLGRLDEAEPHFQTALEIRPRFGHARNNLGMVFLLRDQLDPALLNLSKAVELQPDMLQAQNNLGMVLARLGEFDEASAHYEQALKIQPGFVEALNNLAWLRATAPNPSTRNGAEAVALAKRAIQISGRRLPELLDTLAASHAEAGQFQDAVRVAREALEIARARKQWDLMQKLKVRLALYEADSPFHQAARTAKHKPNK